MLLVNQNWLMMPGRASCRIDQQRQQEQQQRDQRTVADQSSPARNGDQGRALGTTRPTSLVMCAPSAA